MVISEIKGYDVLITGDVNNLENDIDKKIMELQLH